MESQDDPEARIRDLERPLTEQARTSELGTQPYSTPPHTTPPHRTPPYATRPYQDPYPPPPPLTGPLPPMPPPAGYGAPYPGPPVHHPGSGSRGVWMLAIPALAVGVLAAIGIAFWFSNTVSDTRSLIESFAEPTTAVPSISIDIPPVVIPDINVPNLPGPSAPQAPATPGAPASVAGVGSNRTIVCESGDVSVSGVENIVELTGVCGTVTISGVRNEVRIENTATIGVSGFDNTVRYRDGTPDITQSGSGNSVEQG